MGSAASRLQPVPTLTALGAEFDAEAGYPLSREAAADAFAALLDDPRLGREFVAAGITAFRS